MTAKHALFIIVYAAIAGVISGTAQYFLCPPLSATTGLLEGAIVIGAIGVLGAGMAGLKPFVGLLVWAGFMTMLTLALFTDVPHEPWTWQIALILITPIGLPGLWKAATIKWWRRERVI